MQPTPRHVIPHQTAALSLRIAIVGGSIAGLAAAFALQRAGHDVVILEKSDGKTKSAGPVRCPPNMTRILDDWGLERHVANVGVKCSQFIFKKGSTGELLGSIPLHAELITDLMASFNLVQHGDLQSILLDNALREGVEVRYNSPVKSLDCNPMSVTLETGEVIYAEMVVGADGANSMVRAYALGDQVETTFSSLLTLTFAAPTERLKADPDLESIVHEPDAWTVWVGPGYLIRGNFVHSYTQYAIAMSVPHGLQSEELAELIGENWNSKEKQPSLEELGLKREIFAPAVLKLMDLATEAHATAYHERPPFDTLLSDRGKVVLVGDAAHPIVTSGMHSSALAIEDAEILGSLFGRIHQSDEISKLLSAYEELRLPRVTMLRDYEVSRLAMLSLPDGAMQEMRDQKLKQGMGAANDYHSMDEKTFKEIWGDEMDMFAYHATEVVDDWYSKWGAFMARPRSDSITPTVEVSVSRGR